MKKRSLLLLVGLVAGGLQAADDCCDGPLFRRFNIMVNGGVAPAIFSDRGDILVTTTVCPTGSPTSQLATKTSKFNKAFKQPPFNVGVQVGWAPCCNVEMFGEFNYRRAKGRCNAQCVTLPGDTEARLTTKLDDFQAIGGFAGARYYFDRWACDRLAFFFGLKVGVVNHRKINSCTVQTEVPPTSPSVTVNQAVPCWYESTNTVAGGGQIGFDWVFGECRNFSLFFNAEVLASCGLKSKLNIVANDDYRNQLGLANLVRGNTGTLVSFPINLGLRWWFC